MREKELGLAVVRPWSMFRLLGIVVVVSACGGSPSSPNPAVADCSPETPQCILDRALMTFSVSGVAVEIGSTATVVPNSWLELRVDYTRQSAGFMFHGTVYTRDDGFERLAGCTGGGGGGASASVRSFGSGTTVTSSDPMFAPGHSVRVSVVAAFSELSPPQVLCPFTSADRGVNRAAVQGQRQVVTLVRQ